jgi:uncharacterized protein YrrD
LLLKAKTLESYKLECLDGDIGIVRDFYFDDNYWTIRYLVAHTGEWLIGRQTLISPYALIRANKDDHRIIVNLTKKQIEEGPSWDSDKPVSRQFEVDYNAAYNFPTYWGGTDMWGYYPYLWGNVPQDLSKAQQLSRDAEEAAWDPHLRSTREVTGYHVHANDGEIGHVEDFVIDDETWAIRYLVIDTRNWWPGKRVVVSPRWIERVSWGDSKIFVNLHKEAIQSSPEYTDETLISREYESALLAHYNHRRHWADEPAQDLLAH